MSIFSNIIPSISVTWQKDEAWVLATLIKVKQGIAVFESDLASALSWIANNAATIEADVATVLGLVQASGLTITPAIAAAIAAANKAVAAVNAIQTSVTAGQSSAATLIAGYQAVKQAQVQVATAKAVVAAPVPAAKS